MDVEEYSWLGIVRPEDEKLTVAFITPLAYLHGKWKVIRWTACHELFPTRGKVALFAKDFPDSLAKQIWMFRPEKNMKNNYYFVHEKVEPAPLAQVTDWTSRANHPYQLINLLEKGIAAEDCFCQWIYILFQSCLYGPIRLEPDADRLKPREYLQSSSTGGKSLIVWRYTLPEDGFLDLTDIDARFTFLDENLLDTPTGKEDWSLPQVTIKQVLQAGNDLLPETEEHVHLVDKRLRELARFNSREGPAALRLDPAILKRAQYIVSNQMELLQDLSAFLDRLPADHPLMKAARAFEAQVRLQEIEQEAESLAQEKREQLQFVQRETEDAEAKLEQLRIAADEARQHYEQTVEAFSTFERSLQERLATLREEPLRVLADLQITASLFPLLVDESRQSGNGFRVKQIVPLAPQLSGQYLTFSGNELNWQAKDTTLSGMTQKPQVKHWNQAAKQAGVKPEDVKICAAALGAGLIPALEGEAAIPALKAVAQIIACGRIAVIPVPLTALTPLDLFGTIDTQRQAFIPATGGLADDILQAQQHPDELLLIVLEGIDRVAGMPVYAPLFRHYLEVRQADSSVAPINLFHPRAVAPEDPYVKLAWFTWPRNVLLTATLDGEMNSLPLPSLCDRWLARFVPKQLKEGSDSAHTSVLPCFSISSHHWQKWEQEVRSSIDSKRGQPGHLDQRQKAFIEALKELRIQNTDAIIREIWPEQFEQEEEEVD